MGHKILLADDSITIQKVIELTFTDEDFELHTVGNGQKAIEEIRTVKPDIVLCDIIMPEKSGYEVCEHIKTSEDLKHIPVLLLTGAFEPFDQERAKKAGCDGFLAKPFEPQTLISKVRELLQSTGTAGASSPAGRTAGPTSTARTEAMGPPPAPDDAGDATVMMSPGMAGPTSPPPGPPETGAEDSPSQEGVGFQESLAEEAGKKELSVDTDDRTMFLGQPEEPPSGPTETTDDIWGEVQEGSSAPSPPEPPVDEGQTVMMSSPIAPEPVEPVRPDTPATPDTFDSGEKKDVKGPGDVADGFTELPSTPADAPDVGSGASDDAWVIPGPDQGAESAEPELTPLGDFGGFDDFSADPPKPAEPPPSAEPIQSTQPSEPLSSPSPGVESRESTKSADETAQPWEPASPPPSRPAAESESPRASHEPFGDLAPSVPPVPSPPVSPASPPSSGFEQASADRAERASPTDADMDALADRVAKKVLSQLSEKVIQEIAWEVVPDLAEALIQKEIEEIKAKIPK